MNLTPYAQPRAWNQMLSLAPSLPQGLILAGPAGVGKKRAAKALFQWLHCAARTESNACGTCSNCLKISDGRHVDLMEIGPKGDTIPVDDLREMQKTLYFAPMDGQWRFVLIDDAHKLNAASANTILKTLEEPPPHTRFFLITHERAVLLPTIVSRCQFVQFSPLGDETLLRILTEQSHAIPPKLMPLCLELMGGGMARANLLANEKTQEFLETAQSLLATGARPGERAGSALDYSWSEVAKLADQLAAAEDARLELFLDLIVLRGRAKGLKENTRANADFALRATYLRRRLERHANKKLVGLATAALASRVQS